MIETDWQKTSTGFRCNILDKFYLEIWETEGVWRAGVNQTLVKAGSRDKLFDTPEEAQGAAEELAQEMMHRDGLIDSDGN